MKHESSPWQTFRDTVVRPAVAFRQLEDDPRALGKGLGVLLFISAIYTLILAVFIARGYPAAFPSALSPRRVSIVIRSGN